MLRIEEILISWYKILLEAGKDQTAKTSTSAEVQTSGETAAGRREMTTVAAHHRPAAQEATTIETDLTTATEEEDQPAVVTAARQTPIDPQVAADPARRS